MASGISQIQFFRNDPTKSRIIRTSISVFERHIHNMEFVLPTITRSYSILDAVYCPNNHRNLCSYKNNVVFSGNPTCANILVNIRKFSLGNYLFGNYGRAQRARASRNNFWFIKSIFRPYSGIIFSGISGGFRYSGRQHNMFRLLVNRWIHGK